MDRTAPAAARTTAHLDSSALGRHLLAAEDATTMRALLAASPALDLPDDGDTDIAPLIQRAYDEGAEAVRLVSGRTYLWDSPVFLDRGSVLGGFVIEGAGAVIRLGPGLPTAGWSSDPATRFAVFPNTRRSALSHGVVAVTDATRATGPRVGAVRPLTVRDVVLDGGGANRGFSFGNRCAVTFDQVVLWRARVGATWAGYSDGNTFLGCYSRYGGAPAAQTLVEQVAPGDGLVISGGKGDTPVGFARLRRCRGAVVQGVVTARLHLEECSAIVVQGAHLEGQASGTPMVTVRNSQVVLVGCALYATYDEAVGAVLVDDAATDLAATELTLQDCTAMLLTTPEQRSTTYSPVLVLHRTLPGTRVAARGLQGRQATAGAAGHWRDTAQPAIAAPRSKPLRKALASASARAAIASGDFDLRSAGGAWEVQGPGGLVVSRRQGAPSFRSVTADVGMTRAGLLTPGARYSYVVAVQDASGRFTTRSAPRSVRVAEGGAVALEIAVAHAPGVLVLWRSSGDASATPDRVAVLPARSSTVTVLDTGDQVAGRPWERRRIPDPAALTRNRTRDAVLIGTKAVGA